MKHNTKEVERVFGDTKVVEREIGDFTVADDRDLVFDPEGDNHELLDELRVRADEYNSTHVLDLLHEHEEIAIFERVLDCHALSMEIVKEIKRQIHAKGGENPKRSPEIVAAANHVFGLYGPVSAKEAWKEMLSPTVRYKYDLTLIEHEVTDDPSKDDRKLQGPTGSVMGRAGFDKFWYEFRRAR